jgi:hypothetical protein
MFQIVPQKVSPCQSAPGWYLREVSFGIVLYFGSHWTNHHKNAFPTKSIMLTTVNGVPRVFLRSESQARESAVSPACSMYFHNSCTNL